MQKKTEYKLAIERQVGHFELPFRRMPDHFPSEELQVGGVRREDLFLRLVRLLMEKYGWDAGLVATRALKRIFLNSEENK